MSAIYLSILNSERSTCNTSRNREKENKWNVCCRIFRCTWYCVLNQPVIRLQHPIQKKFAWRSREAGKAPARTVNAWRESLLQTVHSQASLQRRLQSQCNETETVVHLTWKMRWYSLYRNYLKPQLPSALNKACFLLNE